MRSINFLKGQFVNKVALRRAQGYGYMFSIKMSEGGQVVVPAEIRRALGVAEGETLLGELRDRACLALARQLGRVAVTCDGAWQKIDPALGIGIGIGIESLRPGQR